MIEFFDGRLPPPVSLRSVTRHRGVVSPICRPCAAAESRLLAPDQVGAAKQTKSDKVEPSPDTAAGGSYRPSAGLAQHPIQPISHNY